MEAVLNWILAHGFELALVTLAWIVVGVVGTAAVMAVVRLLPDTLTHALAERIERRKQYLSLRLHEGEHLVKEQDMRAKLARPVEREEERPFPTRRI